MAKRRRRRLLPVRTKRSCASERVVQTVLVNNERLAYWKRDSIVEINIHDVPEHEGDPNRYWARCLSSGTFPELEIVDDSCDPHPDFPSTLTKGQYAIWREI
jgi:hypothetical protein